MLNWIVIFQLFSLVAPNIAQVGPVTWTKFVSEDEQFSISVPGEMQLNTTTIETSLGSLEHLTFYFKDTLQGSENYLYTISFCDYPKGTFHPDSLELNQEFLNVTVQESILASKGELLYDDEVAILGHTGRIWKVSVQGGKSVIKNKAVLAGDRYYSLQVFTLTSKSRNNNTDRFLDSFIIL